MVSMDNRRIRAHAHESKGRTKKFVAVSRRGFFLPVVNRECLLEAGLKADRYRIAGLVPVIHEQSTLACERLGTRPKSRRCFGTLDCLIYVFSIPHEDREEQSESKPAPVLGVMPFNCSCHHPSMNLSALDASRAPLRPPPVRHPCRCARCSQQGWSS
jgi:hypothetical protein